jgi:hypothetical protein
MRSRSKPLLLATAIALALFYAGCSQDSHSSNSQSDAPILIEPRIGVGKVRAGMNITNVIHQLGEPQRRTANALEYTSLGFAVMPGPDGIVQVVMCGDVTGINGPLVNAFTGRTKEGVGLKSTREELVKAYGDPTSSEKMRGGAESMAYQSLGITFTLEAGKVYHMIIRLSDNRQPLPTVTLEPAQPDSPK